MSDEQPVWSQQENEPALWFRRFEQFRFMEPVRSVAAVFHEENTQKHAKTRKNKFADGTWYAMAQKWQWNERVQAWDAYQTAQQEKIIQQERAAILKSRYALMHKRVQELDRIAQKLIDYAEDENKVWVPDVKAIGNGPDAERVDLVQFNDALFREIRGYFTDIAAELGERVKTTKQELTGKDGVPMGPQVVFYVPKVDEPPTLEEGGQVDGSGA